MKKELKYILFFYTLILLSSEIAAQSSFKYIENFHTKTESTFYSPIFTNDGNFVLATGNDGFLNKWNLKSEFPIKQKELSDKALYAVALTPNGKHILTGGLSGTLYLCNAESFEVVKQVDGFNNIQKITIAPNSEIAYIQTNGDCKLVNVLDLSIIGKNGYASSFNAFFSSDSKLLYNMGRSEMSITNTSNAETKKFVTVKKNAINVLVTPNKSIMIVGVQEGYKETTIIKIVNLDNGEIKNLVEMTKSGDYATPLCFVNGTNKIIYDCYDGIYILDYNTFETKKINGDFDAMELKIATTNKYAVALARGKDGIRLLEIKN